MTAKEKAVELYNKFRNENAVMTANIRAKKQALISIDEILLEFNDFDSECNPKDEDAYNFVKDCISNYINFYEQVKEEIEKL